MWGGDALEEDTDKEYRYWLFLEHFPGHRMQAHNVHHDAVDLVSWVLSETNAKAPEPAAPFSKKEAENLMALLKTFEDGARHGSTPSIAHTRLISRIFLRSLDFRRTTMGRVRPFPTLPTTQSAVKPRPSGPVSKYIRSGLTALVSFLGLGIPLLFSRRSRFDEEAAGYQDTATPSLMLGASVCLVAAVLLSAAVSFLSLPGLENVPRIAILIAAIFASFAMISTVFTIFRLKSDLETAALWLGGGEDLLMISNRTILLSLPIVFLAYAIIAFVVGLVMYTFFANFEGGGGKGIEELFGEYGRWIVVAVVGALAGIFFATIVALKQ
ncbi:hypothetical protein DL96DRAFT_1466720 [Flagelloscypha sp. PMI_526]|nr:hypothetical protein DL96DRAFT_1466720 [Flagelloscypha sp. PMI_526]